MSDSGELAYSLRKPGERDEEWFLRCQRIIDTLAEVEWGVHVNNLADGEDSALRRLEIGMRARSDSNIYRQQKGDLEPDPQADEQNRAFGELVIDMRDRSLKEGDPRVIVAASKMEFTRRLMQTLPEDPFQA